MYIKRPRTDTRQSVAVKESVGPKAETGGNVTPGSFPGWKGASGRRKLDEVVQKNKDRERPPD